MSIFLKSNVKEIKNIEFNQNMGSEVESNNKEDVIIIDDNKENEIIQTNNTTPESTENNCNKLKRGAEDDEDFLEISSKRLKIDVKSRKSEAREIDNFINLIEPVNIISNSNWTDLNNIKTAEGYFNHVTTFWQSSLRPNPHEDLTKRFVKTPMRVTETNSNNDEAPLHIAKYYNDKINILMYKMYCLDVEHSDYTNCLNQINNQFEKIREDKNQVLIVNKFYKNNHVDKSGQYLSDTQYNYIVQQNEVLEKIQKFYE